MVWNSTTLHTSWFTRLLGRLPNRTHLLLFSAFGSWEERKINRKMQKGICFFTNKIIFLTAADKFFRFHLDQIFWRWLSSIWYHCLVFTWSASWLAVTTAWLWHPIRLRKASSSFCVQCNITNNHRDQTRC